MDLPSAIKKNLLDLATLVSFISFLGMGFSGRAQDFVQVRDGHFMLHGKPYRYFGTNFWQGMHLGSQQTGDRGRLVQELDHLKSLGITNLRIMAISEGPDHAPWCIQPALRPDRDHFSEDLLQGLDFLLTEMQKRDMKAVVCLGNFWPWSGGMAQLVSWATHKAIPYPPPAEEGSWTKYMLYTSQFYKIKAAQDLYLQGIDQLISRINLISQVPYIDDPTIMSWQLANEPRGMMRPKAYRSWIKSTAKHIKAMDPNHMVSIGSEGATPSKLAGNRFDRDHDFAQIDYTTIHIWIQNWGWYDPAKPGATYAEALQKAIRYLDDHLMQAQQLNKPLVLEEFGIARDASSYDPGASTTWRDRYLSDLMGEIVQRMSTTTMSGANFWAWAGAARPSQPGGFWHTGDPLIGDPPHEHQGWYSVYDDDHSTLDAIQKITQAIGALD